MSGGGLFGPLVALFLCALIDIIFGKIYIKHSVAMDTPADLSYALCECLKVDLSISVILNLLNL